ncbi:hypothetical protein KKA24_00915, partial [Patescibacteria group bacterium]|nr:hypothetical protein [Patescibacteria group bacterium]
MIANKLQIKYTKDNMISYLNGQLIVKKEKFIIIDVNGVG